MARVRCRDSILALVIGVCALMVLGACTSAETDAPPATPTRAPFATAQCRQGADWPASTDLTPVGRTAGDIDFDGLADDVSVFAERIEGNEGDEGNAAAWVRVRFGNLGVVTGPWAGQGFEPVDDLQIRVTQLSASPEGSELAEIILQVGQPTGQRRWSVLATQNCELVTTSLDGAVFEFNTGSDSGISSSGGCIYDAEDEVAFVLVRRDLNEGAWDTENYELRATEWQLIDSTRIADFPVGDGSVYFPIGPTLDSCVPAPG